MTYICRAGVDSSQKKRDKKSQGKKKDKNKKRKIKARIKKGKKNVTQDDVDYLAIAQLELTSHPMLTEVSEALDPTILRSYDLTIVRKIDGRQTSFSS